MSHFPRGTAADNTSGLWMRFEFHGIAPFRASNWPICILHAWNAFFGSGGSGMEWRHCTRVPINSDAAFSPHGRQPTFSIARIWQKEWERLNSFPEDLAAGSQLDIPSGPVQAGLAGCFFFFFFPSVANGNRLQRPKEVGPFWMCRCFNEAGGMRNQKRENTVSWGLEAQHELGF